MSKVCIRCKHEYDESENAFSRNAKAKDRLSYECRQCKKVMGVEYRSRMPDSVREKQNKQHHDDRLLNPERVSNWRRRYRETHREQIAAAHKDWCQRNKLARCESRSRYYARKLGAKGSHTIEDIIKRMDAQQGTCFWCGVEYGEDYEVDHIIALSRGGSNSMRNIVIACGSCNASKCAKSVVEWDWQGRFLKRVREQAIQEMISA